MRGELTPPTWFTNSEGQPRVYFKERGSKPNFLGNPPTEFFEVDRARVCLACGHVMLEFSPRRLADLRAKLPAVEVYDRE